MKRALATLAAAVAVAGCHVTVVPVPIAVAPPADTVHAHRDRHHHRPPMVVMVTDPQHEHADDSTRAGRDHKGESDHRPGWAARPHEGGPTAPPPGVAKKDGVPPGQAEKDHHPAKGKHGAPEHTGKAGAGQEANAHADHGQAEHGQQGANNGKQSGQSEHANKGSKGGENGNANQGHKNAQPEHGQQGAKPAEHRIEQPVRTGSTHQIVPVTIPQLLRSDAFVGKEVRVMGMCLARSARSAVGRPPATPSAWRLGVGGSVIWVSGARPRGCTPEAGSKRPVTIVAKLVQERLPAHGKGAKETLRYLVIR